jgi:hypothetical protein
MTHVSCPSCSLRFTPASAPTLRRCPFCGGGLLVLGAESLIGSQLVEPVVSLWQQPPGGPTDLNA